MNSRKQIMRFIRPNFVPAIILLLFPPFLTLYGLFLLLFDNFPAKKRAEKNIEKLAERKELEQAAAEMTSEDAEKCVKGKVILTDHYVFCKGSGLAIPYDEILWAYDSRYVRRRLFIPVVVKESLWLATKDMKPKAVAVMGRDRHGQIHDALTTIQFHNVRCLIGDTEGNASRYKQLTAK